MTKFAGGQLPKNNAVAFDRLDLVRIKNALLDDMDRRKKWAAENKSFIMDDMIAHDRRLVQRIEDHLASRGLESQPGA